MPYLQNPDDIIAAIARLKFAPILWVDTEVADFRSKQPHLSLIQISANSADLTGEQVLIFDVLDRPELVEHFIQEIMVDEAIAKVFHNAAFDRKYLGKTKAKNIICTLELAKKIPYYLAPKPDNSLKSLAEHLCHFPKVDKELQGSEWGDRPLSAAQLEYAKLDPVYTAQVHHRLLQLQQQCQADPDRENIVQLTRRYRQIEHDWQMLNSEVVHLKDRIKAAMTAQKVEETVGFKLSYSERKIQYVKLSELAQAIASHQFQSDTPIKLTKALQKEFEALLSDLPIDEKITQSANLKAIDINDSDVPF
ncbi:3'-5' exonuclease [[Leptolyngbya] sp. PCC 7376]|uniref:3'-5' exonuclease n=1 Tax=[Leptolyngbya] sp. PCC 7376 TaxID=111781 RepID=UPI00029EEBF0|nr:3'-5' exonuclease [[Leptolyngbya] sp. PCC 7376]AFY40452.1 3'-5' exonuclease [[Leptolyngbya] sp. PCC 7376]